MFITLSPRLCGIRVRHITIFGDESKRVTFVCILFCVVGFWRDAAQETLTQAIQHLDHTPEWIYLNWPQVKMAKKKAYAKGRAQGKAEAYPWKDAYMREHEKAVGLEQEKWRLVQTIETLRNMDSQKGGTA